MKRPFAGPTPDADEEQSVPRWERAMQRYQAIAAVTPGDPKYVEGRTLVEQVRILQKEGHPLAPSMKTLHAWRKAYLQGDRRVPALLDHDRGGRGGFRGKMSSPDMQVLVQDCERQLIVTSGRQYPPASLLRAKVLGRVGALRAATVPGENALDRFRRQAIPADERLFLARGERAFLAEGTGKPPAHYADRHGVMLVVDHRQGDARVKYGGRELRPWITAGTDPVSGACRAFVTSPVEPSATEVALCLRDAIRRKPEDREDLLCGLPKILYSDMGRDLRSQQIRAALHELRIEQRTAKGYSPWTRGSHEGNFNKMMASRFEPNLPGYVGNSPKTRPPEATAALTYAEWAAAARRWALIDFNNLPYQRRRLNGQRATRLDFARESRTPLEMPHDDTLMLALLKRERRTVQPNGISLGGMFIYWADELFPLVAERAQVEIRFDPADMSRVYVFYKGELLCVARDARAAAAAATEADMKQRHRLRAEHVKHLREATRADREAAMSGQGYLEYLEVEQAAEVPAVAVAGGQRIIRQINPRLDRAAQRLRRMGDQVRPARRAAVHQRIEPGPRILHPWDKPVELEEWEK